MASRSSSNIAEQYLHRDVGLPDQDVPQAWFASELTSLPDFWDSTLGIEEQEKRLASVTQRQLEFVQSLGFFDAEATLEFRIVRSLDEERPLRFFYIAGVEDGAMAEPLWRLFHSGFPGDLDFRLTMLLRDEVTSLFNPLGIEIDDLQLYEWVPRPKVLALPEDPINPVPLVHPMQPRLDGRVQVLRLLAQYQKPLVLGYAIQPVSRSEDAERIQQMQQIWQRRLSIIDTYMALADTAGGLAEIHQRFGDRVVDLIGRDLFDTMGNDSLWQIIYDDIRQSTIYNQFNLSPRYILQEAEDTALRFLQTRSYYRWRVHAASVGSLSDELKTAVGSDLGRRNDQTLSTHYDCVLVRSAANPSYRPLEPPRNYREIRLRSCRRFLRDSAGKYVPSGEYLDDQGATALLSPPILPQGGIPGIVSHQANPFSGWQLYESSANQRRIEIGSYMDSRVALLGQHGHKVRINLDDLTRHTLITGSTGAGKSTTCKRLLIEAHKQEIPFLVIEPVKDEYSDLWFSNEYTSEPTDMPLSIYQLGSPECGLWFNPFYIRKGISLDTHISFLQSAFLAAFPMPGVFGMVFSEVIRDAYSEKAKARAQKPLFSLNNNVRSIQDELNEGDKLQQLRDLFQANGVSLSGKIKALRTEPYWTIRAEKVYLVRHEENELRVYELPDDLPYTGIIPIQEDLTDADFPTLDDLITSADRLIGKGKRLNYTGEFGQNLKTAINFRLEYLKAGIVGTLLQPRRTFVPAKKSFEAQLSDFLRHPVVFQLRLIADKGEKALFMGFLLTALYEYYEQQPTSETLGHITLIEEAHVLLENVPRHQTDDSANTQGKAIELFADMLAEVRSRGEGLIIVEQLPSKLISEAIKNTNLKIMHRLTAKEDRDVLGAAMNFNEHQSQFATTLSQGQAIIFREGLSEPALVKIRSVIVESEYKKQVDMIFKDKMKRHTMGVWVLPVEIATLTKQCRTSNYIVEDVRLLYESTCEYLRTLGLEKVTSSAVWWFLYRLLEPYPNVFRDIYEHAGFVVEIQEDKYE